MLAVVLAAAIQPPMVAACPATEPLVPALVPPPPYPEVPPTEGAFWFGTNRFWTMLPRSGRASAHDKSFWWTPGFNGAREPHPDLRITATSLETGFLEFMRPATNASHPSFGGWTMLVMLEFPATGCWRVTATYGGQSVTYVTEVLR